MMTRWKIAYCLVCAVSGLLLLRAQTGAPPPRVEPEYPLPPPEQPIPFNHKQHVALGLKCLDCHAIKEPGFQAGYPAESRCMACHVAIRKDSPHIQKLAGFHKAKEPVPWVKVYEVPDYVWFSHDSHHRGAGISCEHCHGPVSERTVIAKEKSTSMQACMDCHAKYNAPNDCDFCHDPG
jgi:hypothetical protein